MDYSKELFENYRKTRTAFLDRDVQEKLDYYNSYYNAYYKDLFDKFDSSINFLEIGCNSGYALKVISNKKSDWNFTGIDLSSEDLNTAKSLLNTNIKLFNIDFFDFAPEHINQYDFIYTKAVMEHIDKKNTMLFLNSVKNCLKVRGGALIEVSNMDWIYANHERYMDFTHEVGFTQESLRQVLINVFGNAEIYYSDDCIRNVKSTSLKTHLARSILSWLLCNGEPTLSKKALFSRSIIGFVKNEYI